MNSNKLADDRWGLLGPRLDGWDADSTNHGTAESSLDRLAVAGEWRLSSGVRAVNRD